MTVQDRVERQAGIPGADAAVTPRAELRGVAFAYRADQPLFQDFSWRVAPGDAWAVIGPSGCANPRRVQCAWTAPRWASRAPAAQPA